MTNFAELAVGLSCGHDFMVETIHTALLQVQKATAIDCAKIAENYLWHAREGSTPEGIEIAKEIRERFEVKR